MIYRFLILSDEVDDFVREIQIDSEATFFDFHTAILQSTDYNENQMTSFFLCDDNWEKEQEITLIEMDSSSEYDNLIMENSIIGELIADEGQKLLYVFDYLSDRAFFIELKEIIPSKSLEKAICSLKRGKAPEQILNEDDFIATLTATASASVLDDSFYGDEGYDLDELDEEGFSDLDSNEADNSYEETNF
ncbi:MAG: plasmid pRiA4b ORF-3 family protein [Prevotellaceae bacterium]|jgi:hypothetical protein|nr:plasmid pRiA4b ORF-3 family protein [Prevotellaceae bacterium]